MLPQSVRIFVCTTPKDMRRSFDTLAVVTKQELGIDPQKAVPSRDRQHQLSTGRPLDGLFS